MRKCAKQLANGLGLVLVLPFWIAYLCSGLILGKAQVFPGFSQLFCLLPGITGQYMRRSFYRLVLDECGDDACIAFGTIMSHHTVRLGPRCYVGSFCMLGDVNLEQDVLVGSNVSIINGNRQHGIDRLDIPIREQVGEFPKITIGQDAWIGDRALIMANVGKHAVIGAATVVTKPIPDFAIVVGVPARTVGTRDKPSHEKCTDNN